MKLIIKIITPILVVVLFITSCSSISINKASNGEFSTYKRYEKTLLKAFDVYSTLIIYAKSENEFENYSAIIYEKMLELDQLYDIYNNYDEINNLKTINDMAGNSPVKVDQQIIDLLIFGKNTYNKTNGTVNIAMGSVLSLWHEARIQSLDNPTNAYIPEINQLKKASENTDIDNLVIDEIAGTVYLSSKGMSLDVGAIAKGYATQIAIDEAKKSGLTSGILNAGGNVITIGRPMEAKKESWIVGIQDPKKSSDGVNNILDSISANNSAVITSGSYQRLYEVNGISYNHIIDPKTLMPANNYTSVTIIHSDAGIADMLSTALFNLPLEHGEEILKEYGAEAMWIMQDDRIVATEGYKNVSNTLNN